MTNFLYKNISSTGVSEEKPLHPWREGDQTYKQKGKLVKVDFTEFIDQSVYENSGMLNWGLLYIPNQCVKRSKD